MMFLLVLFLVSLVYAMDISVFCKSVEDMYRVCSSAGGQGVDCNELGSQVYRKMSSSLSPKLSRDFSVLCMASCVAEQTGREDVKKDIQDYIKRCKEGNP